MRCCVAVLLMLAACGGLTVAPNDAGSGGSDGSGASDGSVGSFGSSSGAASEDGSVPRHDDGAVMMEAQATSDTSTGLPDVTTTAPEDAGPPPAVGSPACEDVPCVLCADDYYHCHASVYAPCPPGLHTGTNCLGSEIPTEGCFSCASDGHGWLWQCTVADGGWNLTSFDCTP